MSKVKKLRNIYCAIFSLFACLLLAFSVKVSTVEGSAQGVTQETQKVASVEDFSLEAKTSIWIGNDEYLGIRFISYVDETYIKSFENATIQYWTIIAPAENVNNDASLLTVDNYKEKEARIINYTKEVPNFDDTDTTFTYYGAIKYNFSDDTVWTEENRQKLIDLPLVARPCLAITYEDGTQEVVYANLDGTAAVKMRDTAKKALADEATNAENGVVYTSEQLSTLLSYAKAENTNAYHDSVDVDTLAFIDNTEYQGYSVYTKTVENNEAKFEEIGTFEEGETATLTNNIFAEAVVGDTNEIYLCNGTDFVKTTVAEVTQIIYDAEDLKIFDFDTLTVSTTLQGTYVLANDIVDTDETYNDSGNTKGIFQGNFDGLGHSLTFKTRNGLFGLQVSGSSVWTVAIKNVNFKGCTILSDTGYTYQSSLLGRTKATARFYLQNLSVSLSDATYNNLISNTGKNSYILMYNTANYNSIVCQNVMLEFDYSKLPTADATSEKNIYVVSKLSDMTSNFNVLAKNKAEGTTYARELELIEDTELNKGTVTKYDSYEALEAYYATEEGKTALATFDTTYWDVTKRGYPVWASSYNELDYVEFLGTGMFSGWTDVTEGFETDTDGDNQVLPFDIGGTIKGVYLKESISTVEDFTDENNLYKDGKVDISNTATRAIEYKTVIIQTEEGNLYEATLEIYTRIINSKEDLRMFDFDTATTKRTLTGYYALGSDIVDTEEIYNTTYSTKSYFQGVFDGKGHSLTFKTVGGLFSNKIKGAGNLFVKNVNFKDCTITVNKDNPSAHTLIGSLDSSSTVTLQNVSVSLSEQTYTNFAEDTAPNLYVVAYDNVQNRENKTEGNLTSFINCINVMVEIDYNKIPEAETTSETKFITIISKLRNGTSNFNVVVLNYDDTKTYARFVKLLDVTDLTEVSMGSTAVTQYDSYEALKTYFDANASALATFDTTYWDVENGYPVWKEMVGE